MIFLPTSEARAILAKGLINGTQWDVVETRVKIIVDENEDTTTMEEEAMG